MDINEYKRAVRTMGDVRIEDKAIVVSIMRKDGQIVTRNMGDADGREEIYRTLRVLPASTRDITTVTAGKGAWQ